MSKKPESVIVKKRAPYPFRATLEVASVKKVVNIVHLEQVGFIANMGAQMVSVGEHYQAILELPLEDDFLATPVRVWKTYDTSVVDGKAHRVDRMAEFHFGTLEKDKMERIAKFMTVIRQTK